MSQDILEKLTNSFFARVDDTSEHDRKFLCGEPAQFDDDGQRFFEIPVHQLKYILSTLPHMKVAGAPFQKDGDVKRPVKVPGSVPGSSGAPPTDVPDFHEDDDTARLLAELGAEKEE